MQVPERHHRFDCNLRCGYVPAIGRLVLPYPAGVGAAGPSEKFFVAIAAM